MLFSIITPTHNRCDLLPRAIESMLAQDDENWELIIVDDGSTDDTLGVVTGFTDERIRYVFQENQQLNGARNTGVAQARGAYLGFLDDDDTFKPNHLSRLRTAIEADGGKHDIYRSGEILMRDGKATFGYNYENELSLLPQFWAHPTGLFGMLITSSILKNAPFDEAHLLLDDFLWLNLVLPQVKFLQIDAYTAVVNLHADQRSAHYLTDELLQKNISRLAEAYNLPGVSEQVPFEAYQQQVFHQYAHYSRQLGRKGHTLKAIKIWRKALSYATTDNAREIARTLILGLSGR